MPELRHYDNEILNYAYIYTNEESVVDGNVYNDKIMTDKVYVKGNFKGKYEDKFKSSYVIKYNFTYYIEEKVDVELIRSHQLPFGARQPGPSRAPYGRLLADADRARRHSQSPGIGHCRVRDAASSALENRRPCRRDHEPHSPCVRRGMSRSRPDPLLAWRAAAARSLTGGACAPVRPTHPSSALQSTGRQAAKSRRQSYAPRQMRCAAASIGPKNRTLTNRTG